MMSLVLNEKEARCLIKPARKEDLDSFMEQHYDCKVHDLLFEDQPCTDIFARAEQNKILRVQFVTTASYLCYYVDSNLFDDFITTFVAMNKVTEATRMEIVGGVLKATGTIVAPTVTAIITYCINNPKMMIGLAGGIMASKGLVEEFGVVECARCLFNVADNGTKAVGWCTWAVQGVASLYIRSNRTV